MSIVKTDPVLCPLPFCVDKSHRGGIPKLIHKPYLSARSGAMSRRDSVALVLTCESVSHGDSDEGQTEHEQPNADPNSEWALACWIWLGGVFHSMGDATPVVTPIESMVGSLQRGQQAMKIIRPIASGNSSTLGCQSIMRHA